jgi:hypothetical protein
MKKSIFMIDKANISQLFLLDKLVSRQRFIMLKKYFRFLFYKDGQFFQHGKNSRFVLLKKIYGKWFLHEYRSQHPKE